MSLRSQLEELLPELLPSDPAQAIKGTELIRLVRLRLDRKSTRLNSSHIL